MTLALAPRNSAFGEFRLRAFRGGGGFSDVYEAVSPRGRRVAIKVLRAGSGTPADSRRRFQREQLILETLDVQRIARLVHAELDSDPPWIASEYVDGPTLREAVAQRGALNAAEAAALLGYLARTLSEIHAAGVAHRDLSPNNVMLGEVGPVIIDFGSAKDLLTAAAGSVLSVATPDYASPEALQGKPAGSAADVYALARIVQFAMTGVDKESSFDGLPPEQVSLLRRCLANDPAARPSAPELAAAFGAGNLPSRLRSDHYAPVALKPLPRRLRPTTAVLAALLAASVAALGTWLLATRSEVVTFEEVANLVGGSFEAEPQPVESTWFSTVPSGANYVTTYRRPIDVGRGRSAGALEAYEMRAENGDSVRISAEVIDSMIADETKAVTQEVGSRTPLGQMPQLQASLANEVSNIQASLVVPDCEVVSSTHALTYEGSVRVAAATRDCVVDGLPRNVAVVLEVSPAQFSMVVTVVSGGSALPSLRSVVSATRNNGESLLGSLSESSKQLLGEISSGPGLEIHEGSRFVRRAYRLPAGRSMLVTAEDEVTARLSFLARPMREVDKSTDVIGLGSIELMKAGESLAFDNGSSQDWAVIVEFDERSGPSSAKLRSSLSALATVDESALDFSVGRKAFESTGVAVGLHALPRFSGELPAVVYQKIADVSLPIPGGWVVTSENNSRSAIAFNANPTSSYLAFLESDAPRLDVVSERVSDILDRRRVEEWLRDRSFRDCGATQMFRETRDGVRFEWQVYSSCTITDAIADPRVSAERHQFSPIIRFGLSVLLDTNGDNAGDFDFGVLRGEFVPAFVGDSIYWSEFVDSVVAQFDLVRAAQIKTCESVFGANTCRVAP